MSMLKSRVLVLNKSYLPVNIVTVDGAITIVYSRDAHFLGDDGRLYSWDEWMGLPVIDGDEYIGLTHDRKIRVPVILRLNNFNKLPFEYVKFSRSNIFARDGYVCQYCNEKLDRSKATIDHVCPKSRGGGNSWENTVTSCKPCNLKKADRTPHEAKMSLSNEPYKPRLSQLKAQAAGKIPSQWKPYFKF